MDAEVEQIKNEQFKELKQRELIMIVRADYGYDVLHWSPTGVAPVSGGYDTPQEAAARACQLLGLTEAIIPQSWPESAVIGPSPGKPPIVPKRGPI